MDRRDMLKASSVIIGHSVLNQSSSSINSNSSNLNKQEIIHSVKHSACKWCYPDIQLESFAERAKDIGLHSIELLDPEEWDVVLDKGLNCAISNGSKLGITKGFNNTNYHKQLLHEYKEIIPQAAAKGINKIICFSGNRNGLSDQIGLENCAMGLDAVVKMAEKYNVQIVMELLNSKIDHYDYQCDRTKWGGELVEKLGSSHFGLLYDIYHMQIMEGDVIRTIQNNIQYISHFHTGGVPGRNELDLPQELNYNAIVKAIMSSGYKGYIGQEFIPTRNKPLVSLKKAIDICNV